MKAGTRVMEGRSWNSRKSFARGFIACSTFTMTAESPVKRIIMQCNLAIVDCTINRRNRRASDDPQDAQRDRQTEQASSSTWSLAIFVVSRFQARMVRVASTTLYMTSVPLPERTFFERVHQVARTGGPAAAGLLTGLGVSPNIHFFKGFAIMCWKGPQTG
jgi:hypothetical protein